MDFFHQQYEWKFYQFIILGQAYCEVKHQMYWVVANSENPLPRGKWLELQQAFLDPSSVNRSGVRRVEWLSSPSRIAISQTSGIWGAQFPYPGKMESASFMES